MLDEVFDDNLQFFETRTENKADGIPSWEGFERLTITGIRHYSTNFRSQIKMGSNVCKQPERQKTSWKKVSKAFQE